MMLKKAVKNEIDSIMSNHVREIIDLPHAPSQLGVNEYLKRSKTLMNQLTNIRQD